MDTQDAAQDRSVVVIGLNGNVVGFDIATGARRFAHRLGTLDVIEILVHADRIYAASASRKIHCFEYPSGRVIGETQLAGGGLPRMLIAEGRLFVSFGGELACLSLDGQVLWHDPMKGMGFGSMCIAVPGATRQADPPR